MCAVCLADPIFVAIRRGMLRGQRLLMPLALSLLFACARDAAEDVDSSEGMLLPNGAVFDTGHDGTVYRQIGEYFGAQGLDLRVNLDGFAPQWPLTDSKTA